MLKAILEVKIETHIPIERKKKEKKRIKFTKTQILHSHTIISIILLNIYIFRVVYIFGLLFSGIQYRPSLTTTFAFPEQEKNEKDYIYIYI